MEKIPNTYVFDAESGAEMARLIDQDRLLSRCMGGLCPEVPDLSTVHDALDVACGPGGWVQEMAYAYPEMRVMGIDISQRMIEYAKALSQVQGLDNARFQVMDALKPLDFPDASFDLVNGRLLISFLHAGSWPVVIKELVRVLRPGGTLRLTEGDGKSITNSSAFEKFQTLMMQAFAADGRSLGPGNGHIGITPLLGRFLQDAGCQSVQEKAHVLNFSSGTEAHGRMYEDIKVGSKLVQPFMIRKDVVTQQEIDQLYGQVLAEWLSEDFRGLLYLLSVWGQKPL